MLSQSMQVDVLHLIVLFRIINYSPNFSCKPMLARLKMEWKEFFRPTIGKLIVPIIFLIWMIYYDLFSPVFGDVSISQRLIMAIIDVSHLIFVIIILLILYIVSCLIVFIINKLKSK